ncbi:MAG: PIN domain-containing protein [Rhodopseudomonas sp.]|uniref:PIN domain-containing protein n=1 Tax=Rhodopseudomonas sp. TaxID=1078 RepID=UPI0039E672AA
MKKRFPGYYRPTDDEIQTIWSKCVFVPDTNILLHLFRYGAKTRSQVITTLQRLRPHVWIPYQVGLEFQKNWREVDHTNRDAYEKLSAEVINQGNKLKAIFDQFTRHQIIDAKKEQKAIDAFIGAITKRLSDAKITHPDQKEAQLVFDEISELIGDSVGSCPTEEEIKKIEIEGEKRYSASIPPGFRDSKKDGSSKFGDLFIWKELLSKAKAENRPIVMISDDTKDDWWYEFRGARIGPRPELVQEMEGSSGQAFLLYSLSQFLGRAAEFLNQKIDRDAIAEIKTDEQQLREAPKNDQHFDYSIFRYKLTPDQRAELEKATNHRLLLEHLKLLEESITKEAMKSESNASRLSTLLLDRDDALDRLAATHASDSSKDKAIRLIAEALRDSINKTFP